MSLSGCGSDEETSGQGGGEALTVKQLDAARAKMVERLREHVEDERLLAALERVPRHEFVPKASRDRSYEDVSLPIGEGQTMFGPSQVAQLTMHLRPKAGDRVLEVGTGSGYQAAIFGELAKEVVTIEIVPALQERAEATYQAIQESGRVRTDAKVRFVVGDGAKGWPESAPYDVILVAAASKDVPRELAEQLAPGGRMVIPVGSLGQELTLVTKSANGNKLSMKRVGFVRWDALSETGG